MDNNVTVVNNNVWVKAVPLKVSLFVWRLLMNPIPTKDNLRGRGVVTNNYCRCIGGCDMVEDSNHLFICQNAIFLADYGFWWKFG